MRSPQFGQDIYTIEKSKITRKIANLLFIILFQAFSTESVLLILPVNTQIVQSQSLIHHPLSVEYVDTSTTSVTIEAGQYSSRSLGYVLTVKFNG